MLSVINRKQSDNVNRSSETAQWLLLSKTFSLIIYAHGTNSAQITLHTHVHYKAYTLIVPHIFTIALSYLLARYFLLGSHPTSLIVSPIPLTCFILANSMQLAASTHQSDTHHSSYHFCCIPSCSIKSSA